MKKFLSIITVFTIISTLFSCDPTKHAVETQYGINVNNSANIAIDTFKVSQLDSMIITDNLPEFKKWSKNYMKDAESKTNIEYRTLIDPTTNIIYTVKTPTTTLNKFIVQKRKINF